MLLHCQEHSFSQLFHILCSTALLSELDPRLSFPHCFLALYRYITLLSCAMPQASCLQFYHVDILLTSYAALCNLGRSPSTSFIVCIPYCMVNDLCAAINHQVMLQLGKPIECIYTQNVLHTTINSPLPT